MRERVSQRHEAPRAAESRSGGGDQRRAERIDRGDSRRGSEGRTEEYRQPSAAQRDRSNMRPDEGRSATREGARGSRDTWRGDRGGDRTGVREADRGRGDRGGTRESYRGGNRNDGRTGSYNRQPYRTSGRVSRSERYGNGYRVWVSGCNYPFFVPLSYYHRDRFRVGLVINIGGIFNPLGYYDYNDRYDRYDRYDRNSGRLVGVVEDVDYRRGTFVVQSDNSRSFITVTMRERSLGEIRRGDYVEIYGDWRRAGVFDAYRVEYLNDDYDQYR